MTTSLFDPLTQRSVTLPNRIAVSPMSQYSANDGFANDWHLVTYGKMAQGGAGLVMVEMTAVEQSGRSTYGDLGIWHNEHIEPLARIARFVTSLGSVPGIQIGHAGRKGSMQRPWEGYGRLSPKEAAKGELPWQTVAPSAISFSNDVPAPLALDETRIQSILDHFEASARRAAQAGFKILEVHAAHGYLLHQFLSPLSNLRDDKWGGTSARRMEFPLAVLRRVRAAWPNDLPLWLRVSAIDGADEGRTIEDTIEFVQAAKAEGVDLVDCSSGGIAGLATSGNRAPPSLGFQVPFAEAVRHGADVPTMAVGLIVTPEQADQIVQSGKADVVALARELLENPNWPHHAGRMLNGRSFDAWPPQFGWWLDKRAIVLDLLASQSSTD
ncbi:NADH:flavin oxidoreductase/NADH oxidase [Noviherbaspirillum sedimenti]|uniref:NADH:flavin oxidoreductase/NADH oxidase n=1 Tax=Noviherbaspirillum sedimenti TaxID=2320865 RepID=A0A3A3G415_9BURK|nr:NADH:flavin oxidoreductase/NADH oxidase [Noviherbaspirillum sedimenti]RJG02415.1 NADH:flavin oxidoreductase/NADH oxidase [Noviherbaspirillum sedimenti]